MTGSHRAYFGLVGLFAAWVGVWGYFVPAEVGRALPWTVPPLHARFVASMYLAGLLAMALSLPAARERAEVRIPLALASIWTGALMVVSLLRLEAFDFGKPQVWFWMGAYAVYPLWGAWLYFRGGAREAAVPRTTELPLAIVGAVLLVLALALFVAPAAMVGYWPWKVTPLLAQIYSGPFVAWGATALLLAREARPAARRIVLVAMLAFCLLAIVASTLHVALFTFDAPAAWAWFGGLAAWAVIVLASISRDRRA